MSLIICGIDEAGRGCLAGPVVSAAIIIDKDKIPTGAKDSKKLTDLKRRTVYQCLVDSAVSYSIGIASNLEIDEINILNASLLSMDRAFFGLSKSPDVAIIDGPFAPIGLLELSMVSEFKAIPVIKGDDKVKIVSCASILAKVYRDDIMLEMDKKFPQYGFKLHKGYATKEHKESIRKYGWCETHRKTFKILVK